MYAIRSYYERDYDPSIPQVRADPSSIRQVVLNLLRNASQAGASQILIRTRIEHGHALLRSGQGGLAVIADSTWAALKARDSYNFV